MDKPPSETIEDRRRDAILKTMLKMPPKPHKPLSKEAAKDGRGVKREKAPQRSNG